MDIAMGRVHALLPSLVTSASMTAADAAELKVVSPRWKAAGFEPPK
jgi:hypothetical protein